MLDADSMYAILVFLACVYALACIPVERYDRIAAALARGFDNDSNEER